MEIDTTLLKEESNQTIFYWHNGKWNKSTFMWFFKENIEVMTTTGQLLSIHKRNFDKLRHTEPDRTEPDRTDQN